jgi:type IV pilus assembly protein PilV
MKMKRTLMMKRATHGFTLIEVLVAVVIVSLGMLGIAGTLLTATRSSSSNYLKQQAVQSAYDIVDRMRANRTTAILTTATSNPYIVALGSGIPAAPNCTTSVCSGTQMATLDISQWETNLQNLPNGTGSVAVALDTVTGASNVTVIVQWSDQPAQSAFSPTTPITPAAYEVVTAL